MIRAFCNARGLACVTVRHMLSEALFLFFCFLLLHDKFPFMHYLHDQMT